MQSSNNIIINSNPRKSNIGGGLCVFVPAVVLLQNPLFSARPFFKVEIK